MSIACDVAGALAARLLRLVGPLGSHSGGFGPKGHEIEAPSDLRSILADLQHLDPNERAGIMALIKAAASARK